MPYLLVRHRVKDYGTWKRVFDDDGARRRESGCRGGLVFRSDDDPNEVVLLLDWEDLGRARAFSESGDSAAAAGDAGVADTPDVYYLNVADRPPA